MDKAKLIFLGIQTQLVLLTKLNSQVSLSYILFINLYRVVVLIIEKTIKKGQDRGVVIGKIAISGTITNKNNKRRQGINFLDHYCYCSGNETFQRSNNSPNGESIPFHHDPKNP